MLPGALCEAHILLAGTESVTLKLQQRKLALTNFSEKFSLKMEMEKLISFFMKGVLHVDKLFKN